MTVVETMSVVAVTRRRRVYLSEVQRVKYRD